MAALPTVAVLRVADGLECVINASELETNPGEYELLEGPSPAVADGPPSISSLLDGNVKKVSHLVASIADSDALDALEAEERAGKNRLGVLRAISEQRDTLDAGDEED